MQVGSVEAIFQLSPLLASVGGQLCIKDGTVDGSDSVTITQYQV